MKKYIYFLSAIVFLPFLWLGCSDEPVARPDETGSEVGLVITMHVPAAGYVTKAVDETLISSVNVLVFEDTGSGYVYTYLVPGYALMAVTESTYEFYARVTATDDPVKLYIIANFPVTDSDLVSGSTEAEIRQWLTGTFTAEGFDGGLPMFGEVDLPDGVGETPSPVTASMVRSVARVDVINDADNFTLTSVQLYRVNDLYQVIPDTLVNNQVTAASVPVAATQSVHTVQLPVTGEVSTQALYLPESVLPQVADRQGATVVVIGGIYGTGTDMTYYRMDFVPDGNEDLFGQVLRNHLYQFTIQEIRAPGWETPDEAAESESTQITAEVVVWNESTVYMVYDEVRYLGVSARTIWLSYSIGAQETVTVQTNLDAYDLYWADAAGNVDTTVAPISWGDSFTDSDSLFAVSISGDGTAIQITANTSNTSGSDVIRYLWIRGGRLEVLLTLIQGVPALVNASLTVYSSLEEIGSLGNQILEISFTSPRERVQAMVSIMQSSANFGPNGTVPIQRILIGGQSGYEISADVAESFNVLYLTHNGNVSQATTDVVLNWLSEDTKRVLIIQYDNQASNPRVLNALGITEFYQRGQSTPYTVYSGAPAIIMDGVFGAVDYSMLYRSYDDTHGEIDFDLAVSLGISPILLADNGRMIFGVDFDRRIVYSGDIDLYSSLSNSRSGEYLQAGGSATTNNASRLIANLWAWIATTALSE
ncbi:MAG: hypothetical protein LIP05_02880 [Tannerellaceae bacterium]|nr:hypothetical protein [Tannerellaceae bacterium]